MLGWQNKEFIVMPITILVTTIISVLLFFVLKKKKEKTRSIPFKIIAIILIMLEVIKQIRGIKLGFDTWDLPFHYCSLFVFFFPLAQLTGEKIKKIFKPVAFACALTVTCGLYITPSSIISSSSENIFGNFPHFHTFTFHYLVSLYCALSIVLKDYEPRKKDYKFVFITMVGYGIVGISLSYLLDTNYCNFLYSVLDFLEVLREKKGQFIYTSFIFCCITFGTSLISYFYYISYKNLKKTN